MRTEAVFLLRSLTVLGLVTALQGTASATLVSTSNCREISVSFNPYVSSYLPKAQGPLTNLQGDTKSLKDFSRPLSQRQIDIFKSSSLMQRLDMLNQAYLGKTTHYHEETRASHYDRGAQGWVGYCNVWSAAASNPEVNGFLNEIGDVQCGDVILTKSEVRELMTGFASDRDTGIVGLRSVSERSTEAHTFRDHSGYDDLNAALLDEKLTDQLEHNLGLVMDIDAGAEVWNQPVFQTRRCEQPMSDVASYSEKDMPVPARLLTSGQPQVRQFLELLEEADQLAQKIHFKQAVPYLQKALRSLTLKPEFAAPAGYFLDRDYNFLRNRAASAVEWLRRQRLVSLNTGKGTFHLVTNTVRYKIESDFAMGSVADQGTDLMRQKTLSYVLVTDPQNRTVDQFWLTPARNRPDTFFTPARIEKIEDQSEVLRDFMEAVGKCRGKPLLGRSFTSGH